MPSVVIVLERSGKAGRQCDIVRELAGDFVVDERFFAEPADRANAEKRGHVAVSIERRGRAPRHGSSWSFGGKRTRFGRGTFRPQMTRLLLAFGGRPHYSPVK